MNNQEVSTAYVGSTEIKEARLGTQLVLAPGGDALWYKANEIPTLDLRFADNKSLVDATTGANLVDFTRATGGTYTDSQGVLRTALVNEPRFDHNPTTGESLGLLVEDSRTNLLLRSEEFDNAYWTLGGSLVTPNATTAPDGTLTADLYTTTGAGQSLYPLAGTTVSPSTSYTFSVYVKLGTMAAGNYKIAFYDVTNAAFIAVDVVPAQVPTTNAWTRVEYTLTTPAGCTTLRAYPYRSGPSIPSSTVYLWGAQLEAGSFPTSYIPTTSATVTRAADVASISGSNFSSWYRQDEGTVFAECNVFGNNGFNQFIYSISDGAIGDEIRLFKTPGDNSISSALEDSVGGTTSNIFGNTNTPFGSPWKTAHAFAANYAIRAVNGISSSADTTVTVPVVNQMRIGARMNETFYGNLHLSRLTYWPQRLPNATLQTITL